MTVDGSYSFKLLKVYLFKKILFLFTVSIFLLLFYHYINSLFLLFQMGFKTRPPPTTKPPSTSTSAPLVDTFRSSTTQHYLRYQHLSISHDRLLKRIKYKVQTDRRTEHDLAVVPVFWNCYRSWLSNSEMPDIFRKVTIKLYLK